MGQQFEQVLKVREFTFPKDHGPHPDFHTEWWYFTGNLSDTHNDRYGYQFTIFRRALTRNQPQLDSDWASNQAYLAHIGVTDVQTGEYLIDEAYSRGALNLAGARSQPFKVWVNNWVVQGSQGECNGCLNVDISAASDYFSLGLKLNSLKPVVLQGEHGLSRKSNEPGNASYYYSLTRLETTGTLTTHGTTKQVSGASWMDHEWFSSVLSNEALGWDWFSLQLNDRRELMLFQIRQRESTGKSFKYGILVGDEGNSRLLDASQIEFTEQRRWKSAKTHAEYPVDWQIAIPELGMTLSIDALADAQERDDSFRYWEGAVSVSGTQGSNAVTGSGYLEMTGY